jgi:hypothetical protein
MSEIPEAVRSFLITTDSSRQLLKQALLMLTLIGIELHDVSEGRVIRLRMSSHGIEDRVALPGNSRLAVHLRHNS